MPMLDVLDQHGLRADAAPVVYGTMLFPGQQEAEDRRNWAAVERGRAKEFGLLDDLPPEDDARLKKLGLQENRLHKNARKRNRSGARVGLLTWCLLKIHADRPGEASINAAAGMVAEIAVRESRGLKTQHWQPLRSAAHLWAAWHLAERQDYLSHNWTRDLTALERFLGIAESVRMMLEHLKPRGAQRPLLRPGEAWYMPVPLERPVHFEMPRLLDREWKAITKLRAEYKK